MRIVADTGLATSVSWLPKTTDVFTAATLGAAVGAAVGGTIAIVLLIKASIAKAKTPTDAVREPNAGFVTAIGTVAGFWLVMAFVGYLSVGGTFHGVLLE